MLKFPILLLLLSGSLFSQSAGYQPPVSNGITITEVIREDGTKEETIYLTECPSSNRPWKYGGLNIDGRRLTFKDMVTPSITLSLHEKMVLKFVPFTPFSCYFNFDAQRKNSSILQPNLISSYAENYSWDHEPFNTSSWALWNWPYIKSWTAKAPGTVLLSFQGNVEISDEVDAPVNVNVLITVTE